MVADGGKFLLLRGYNFSVMSFDLPGAIALFSEFSFDNNGFPIFGGFVCFFALILDGDGDLCRAGSGG
jgi:hypothetical protein